MFDETLPEGLKNMRKIEWGLVLALAVQATALIWGAAKLSAGVDQLNENMESMSDYAVLRYRVEQLESADRSARVRLDILEGRVRPR